MRLWGHGDHLVMKYKSMELSGAQATAPVSGFGSVKGHGIPAQKLSQAGWEHRHLAHLPTGPEPDAIRTVTQIGGWRPWAREPDGALAPATTDRGVTPCGRVGISPTWAPRPPAVLNISGTRRGMPPLPAAPQWSLPGFARAESSNSWSVLAGTLLTSSASGCIAVPAQGTKSRKAKM
jgi:hypothetical protein